MSLIRGTAGNNDLEGTDQDDVILAQGGQDTIDAGAGSDTIILGQGGSDTIDGGTDTPPPSNALNAGFVQSIENDAVVLNGAASTYTLTFSDGSLIAATGQGDNQVTETMVNVESIVFDDYTVRVVGAGSAYATIQDAVNASQDGDTIVVAGGTYLEQLDISGKSNLTIKAADGATVTIAAPAELHASGVTNNGRDANAVVNVEDSTNIVLEGIVVDGAGQGANIQEGVGPGEANFVGVLYHNASGELIDVDIKGVRDATLASNQRGFGLQVFNDGEALDFSMTGGSITDFQKTAGYFTNANLDISDVTVTGAGAIATLAQNGFVLIDSSGLVDGNTITGLGHTGGNVTSTAILVYTGNHDLAVTNNTIVGANGSNTDALIVGVYLQNGNEDIDVSGNTISYVDTGVAAYDQPEDVTIHDNTITNLDQSQSEAYGIDFDPDSDLTGSFVIGGSAILDHLAGAAGDDSLSGLAGNDSLEGREGSDSLDGGDGADTIEGGEGADTLTGGLNGDSLVGGDGADLYSVDNAGDMVVEALGDGTDTVSTTLSIYTLGANVEKLTFGGEGVFRGRGNELANEITGGGSGDNLLGYGGADTLNGGDGNDTLTGGAAADLLTGGAGNDTYVLTNRADTVVELADGGVDAVQVSGFNLNLNDFSNIEAGKLTGAGDFSLTGNDGANRLTGNDGDNSIYGGLGADTLLGGGGSDTFVYNSVAEASRGAGRDVIQGFSQGEDLINLFAIDARAHSTGNNAFNFIGDGAFTAEGQLRASYDAGSDTTTIEANTDGDLRAELKIVLTGFVDINDGDFVL
jgi:hemolysin type calcium-binding protein